MDRQENILTPDLISVDTDTLRKAALFAAWEVRDDNPYEFVVDLSRDELEAFLQQVQKELTAEDRNIVQKILSKEPGYGEDFVEKHFASKTGFAPDIEVLLAIELTVGGDALERSLFYSATRNMTNDQLQALRASVKEKVMAYEAGILPHTEGVIEKNEKRIEKELSSWFREWTRLAGRLESHLDRIDGPVTLEHIEAEARAAMADERYAPYVDKELLGWILNRCVNYGLDYTRIPEDLQYEGAADKFRNSFPELVQAQQEGKQITQNNILMENSKEPKIQIIPYEGTWTRDLVQRDPGSLYIFTDNTDRDSGKRVISRDSAYYAKYGDGVNDLHYPTMTSAVIRGLDNALPVSTQRWYHGEFKREKGRWNDSDLAEFKEVIGAEFAAIREAIIARADSAADGTAIKVYLPGGGDGFAGGTISAITEVRTPRLYAFLKEQEQSLQVLSNLYERISAINQIDPDTLLQVVKESFEQSARLSGEKLTASDANDFDMLTERQLLHSAILYISSLPANAREAFVGRLEGRTVAQEKSPVPEAISAMEPYAIVRLLNDVVFPDRGTSASFDAAYDAINAGLATGWSKDLTPGETKAYLVRLVSSLPSDVQVFLAEQAASVSFSKAAFDETPCDVYTLGFSTRNMDEFNAALPDNASLVIDLRPYPNNRHRPWFNKEALAVKLQERGIEYIHVGELNDASRDRVRDLCMAHPGQVVICSSENSPSKSERGRELGPWLERSGLTVGHITQSFDASKKHWDMTPRVMTQENLTSMMLKTQEIANGSYKQVSFDADGNPVLVGNVSLRPRTQKLFVDRNIYGHHNFGNPVSVEEVQDKGLAAARLKAAESSHFTFFFQSGPLSFEEQKGVDFAGSHCAKIHMPDDDDKLTSMEYARSVMNAANGPLDKMARVLVNMDSVDLSNIILNIDGANEARIINKPVISGAASEDELQRTSSELAKSYGYDHGLSLVRPSRAPLSAYQTFIKNCLTVANEPVTREIEGETESIPRAYTIRNVVSIGESGAGEAGLNAAAEAGMSVHCYMPKGGEMTLDNETLRGRRIKDVPAFINRFKLGLKRSVTEDQLRTQIDFVHNQGVPSVGLTDRQVLVLSELGYRNSDILLLAEQALINNIMIEEVPVKEADGSILMSGADALLEHIQLCSEGYGIAAHEALTVDVIRSAEAAVDKTIAEARKEGIGILTIANSLYPEEFRKFNGFTRKESGYTFDESNGVLSAGSELVEIKEERPAILFFKGNIDALQSDKVSVVGNNRSTDMAKRAGEEIGRAAAAEDIATVSAFRPIELVKHTTRITAKAFLGEEYQKDETLTGPAFKKTGIRKDSMTSARNAAIEAGGTTIVISPNGLLYDADRDQVDKVVSSGGIVLSEAPFGFSEGEYNLYERAGLLSCALGLKSVIIDSKDAEYAMSPIKEATLSPLGAVYVKYDGPLGMEYSIKGNEDALVKGAVMVNKDGSDLARILAPIRSQSLDETPALQEFYSEEKLAPELTEKQAEDMHVDYFRFDVVRRGTDQIFIVPENYPDVRDALKTAYGDDIKFSDNVGLAKRNISQTSIELFGESFKTFDGYKGTEPLQEPVYSVPLYYVKGEIYSINNAPSKTPGIIESQRVRLENKKAFDEFRDSMLKLQGKFLDEIYQGHDVAKRPIRFENAYYPVITQNSVDLYQGEMLRARVCINEKGAVTIINNDSLSDSLTEYKYSTNVFGQNYNSETARRSGKGSVSATLTGVLVMAESIIMGVPAEETEMFALADRETRNMLQTNIETGMWKPANDNIDVASSDVFHAEEASLLPELPSGEKATYDKSAALAAIDKEQSSLAKEIMRLAKEDKRLEKGAIDAENARNAAYSEGLAESEYEALDKTYDDMLSQRADGLKAIYDLKLKLAQLEDGKTRLAVAESVILCDTIGEGKTKSDILFVDGARVEVKSGLVPKSADLSKYSAELDKLSAAANLKKESFAAGIDKIEAPSMNLQNVGELYDRRHADDDGNKALKEEIKPGSFSNGRYIVVRDGKMAYADQALNIRSEFYDSLDNWGGRFGLAKNGGKNNFINAEGQPIVEKWFDERGKVSEGVFVIKVDDEFGLIGENGQLFGGRMFQNAHSQHDGWCLVQGGFEDGENAGMFNFINADGEFISKKWFDEAGDFENGLAPVSRNGRNYRIDTKGNEFDRELPGGGGAPGLKEVEKPKPKKGTGGRK